MIYACFTLFYAGAFLFVLFVPLNFTRMTLNDWKDREFVLLRQLRPPYQSSRRFLWRLLIFVDCFMYFFCFFALGYGFGAKKMSGRIALYQGSKRWWLKLHAATWVPLILANIAMCACLVFDYGDAFALANIGLVTVAALPWTFQLVRHVVGPWVLKTGRHIVSHLSGEAKAKRLQLEANEKAAQAAQRATQDVIDAEEKRGVCTFHFLPAQWVRDLDSSVVRLPCMQELEARYPNVLVKLEISRDAAVRGAYRDTLCAVSQCEAETGRTEGPLAALLLGPHALPTCSEPSSLC